MSKMKKLSLFICSIMLVLTGCFFVACGTTDYSNISLTSDYTSITMDVGEERTINFTIENYFSGMDQTINFSVLSSPNSISYVANQPHEGKTALTITALHGGSVTLRAVSVEGLKECTVSIFVNEYSSSIQNSNENLYVSDSTAFVPTSANFVFDVNSTARDLTYYFYGMASADDRALTLQDVMSENGYIQEFNKVELVKNESDQFKYLVFTTPNGAKYTIRETSPSLYSNVFYSFIPLTDDFAGAQRVTLGQKFTFLARYSDELYVQRDFYVLNDIKDENVLIESAFLRGNNSVFQEDFIKTSDIRLVPNRDDGLSGFDHIDYKTAQLKITLPSSSELISFDAKIEDEGLASLLMLGEENNSESKVITYQISSRTITKSKTKLIFNYYYTGFKDAGDESVSATVQVPITIEFEPVGISVNNETGSQSQTVYTFYNNYASSAFGWQDFFVTINPNDAGYDELVLNFDPSQVMLRYNNRTYTTGQLILTDFSSPIGIKGVDNEGQTGSGIVELKLKYNIIEAAELSYNIRYNIVAGAKNLAFTDSAYRTEGVYLTYDANNTVVFNGLVADAAFNVVSYQFRPKNEDEVDIIDFVDFSMITEGLGRYVVSAQIRTKAVGNGTYTLTLDNGTAVDVTFRSLEEVKTLDIELNDENGIVTQIDTIAGGKDIYLLNKDNFGSSLTFSLVANGNANSNAIRGASLSKEGEDCFNYTYNVSSLVTVNLTTLDNGQGRIVFTVVSEGAVNFKRTSTETKFTLSIISYSLINRIRVNKLSEGDNIDYVGTAASRSEVYIGTDNENARSVQFEVLTDKLGYHFYQYFTNERGQVVGGNYASELFDKKFIYWTISSMTMVYNESSYDNTYTIGSYGTFNTETMTFTAFAEAQPFEIYLVANIRQIDRIYSYRIEISSKSYTPVEGISLQEQIKDNQLNFSANQTYKELIVNIMPIGATNSDISVIFTPGSIKLDDGEFIEVNLFGEKVRGQYEGITITQIDYVTFLIKLDCSTFVNSSLANSEENLSGSLQIVANDWLDVTGNIKEAYLDRAKPFIVNYANGTRENPFYLETAEDVEKIAGALDAHYRISTAIDMSASSAKLPLGAFSGSITGTNDIAKLFGLNIIEGQVDEESGEISYGLFTKLLAGAEINNVKFEGNINIVNNNTQFVNAGLIAGENYGNITNIGVTITADSSVSLAGSGNIGVVVGSNYGNILQDYTTYTSEKVFKLDENGDVEVDEDGLEIEIDNIFYGLSTNILVYMGDNSLTISSPKNEMMRAGGVAGLNCGSIIKIDNPELKLYGYSQYLAYVNITAKLNDLSASEGDFYYASQAARNFVGGIAGESSGANAKIVGQLCFSEIIDEYGNVVESNYNIGEGVLVGGRVEGRQYVGGVVGKFENVGSEDNETFFQGITSRVFVRGYNKNIGAISGYLSFASTSDLKQYYAVQAVDDRRSRLEATMVIRYLDGVSLGVTDRNQIGFGIDSTVQVLYNEEAGREFDYMLSYSKRSEIRLSGIIDDELIIDDSADTLSYYGDYVEVGVDSNFNKFVSSQTFFAKGVDEWQVSANDSFAAFVDENGIKTNTYFYVNYFEVASLKALNGDLAQMQASIDQSLNTISPQSKLYPIIAANGLNFQSLNSDVLTFDSQGIIQVNKKGSAQIRVSSLLNTNTSIDIYIKAVNYFNSDESLSIVYPETSLDAIAIDEGRIDLKGVNSVTLYVKPNYSLELDGFNIDKNGNAVFDGVGLLLAPNTEVMPEALITSFTGDEVIDNFSAFLNSDRAINIDVNGQTITFSRKDNSLEGRYDLEINTYLAFGNLHAKVNKTITNTPLYYTRGAQSIQLKKHDSITISADKVGVDNILIKSSSEEQKPYYVIYDDLGNIIQGNFDEATGKEIAEDMQKEGLFDVKISPEQMNYTGNQEFDFAISINKGSLMFRNRHDNNIYGYYTIKIFAASNPAATTTVPIYFENLYVNSISVDNYSDISNVEQNADFSTSTMKAHPGRTGLLIINVNPEEADYDYIEIVNTELANVAGNGRATFNLVAKYVTGDKLFNTTTIAGSAISNGIRLNLRDVVDIYATKGTDNKNLYEEYRGLIYVSYMIGTNGVNDGASAEFKISAFSDGEVVGQPKVLNLTLELDYHAYVTINKAPIESSENNAYATYNIARGLRYELNLDYYGFGLEDIDIISSAPQIADVVSENGRYYLQITSREIDYSYSNLGYPVILYVNAYHDEEDNPRIFSSTSQFNILEYVINYQYTDGDEPLDIVKGMDNGVINVQVGNPHTLQVYLESILEYDYTLPAVQDKIDTLIASLSNGANWTAYTNLNDEGRVGQSISIKDFDDTIYKKYSISTSSDFEITYFKARGLDITPVVTHKDVNSYYAFSMDVHFAIKNGAGIYEFTADTLAARLYTEFKLNVFQSSSSEHPIPIYTVEQLEQMQENVHYILMNDLTLDTSFQPINVNIASFDGNGCTIFFNGRYEFNTSNMGLFGTVNTDTVIKNVTIALSGDTYFRNMTSSDFTAGLLAGQNEGSITNCYAYSGHDEYATNVEYVFTCEYGVADSASYVAGLVGGNSGNITNSRASVNITSGFNVGGLVGTNSGGIASSYFKNAKLICNSRYNHYVGGLAVSNSDNGKILTSYTSGENSATKPFTTDVAGYDALGNLTVLPSHFIQSSTPEGGFVYSNNGTIEDCYSNISMFGSNMAGFAFANGGEIRNCFSMSILENKRTASAGFSKSKTIDNSTGTFENCYYFYNSSEDVDLEHGYEPSFGEINSSIEMLDVEGIQALNYLDLQRENLEIYFSEYAYSQNVTANTVWFYSDGLTFDTFNLVQFGGGRLELAAPNIIAYSKKELQGAVVDETTGDVVYNYNSLSSAVGSLKNPYLISSAEEFETNILNPSSASGFNDKSYRLISNIDYSQYDQLSQLYKVIYYGSFEGNGMTVSNIDLISTDKLDNAGMFGQIGRTYNDAGTVMNLTLVPKEVSFVNATCVGALAGTLTYGNLYNISVLSSSSSGSSDIAVLGNNFVGGVVGRTLNSFNMKNITSEVSAIAYNKPSQTDELISYSQSSTNLQDFSYAGSIVGFAAGAGQIHKAYSNEVTDIMGSRIGVAFGGFDSNVDIDYLYVTLSSNLSMKGYDSGYVGLAVGEIKGSLSYVQVTGFGSTASDIFALMPGVPSAVGGVAGLLNGGSISSAYVDQSFEVKSLNTGIQIKNIESAGGVVGYVNGDSRIEKSLVKGNITTSGTYLGGIVGRSAGSLTMDEVAVQAGELRQKGQLGSSYVAGLVGSANAGRRTIISNSYSNADIIVENYVYTSQILASVSHFINSSSAILNHCFSSGSITVTLEDKRQVNGVENIVYPSDGEPTFDKDISYTRNSITAEQVYFFGISDEDVRQVLASNYRSMLAYNAKVDSSTATLTEYTYGLGSRNAIDALINELEDPIEKNQLTNLLTSKSALNEIIYRNSWHTEMQQWTIDYETAQIYLTMEDSFNWLK